MSESGLTAVGCMELTGGPLVPDAPLGPDFPF